MSTIEKKKNRLLDKILQNLKWNEVSCVLNVDRYFAYLEGQTKDRETIKTTTLRTIRRTHKPFKFQTKRPPFMPHYLQQNSTTN